VGTFSLSLNAVEFLNLERDVKLGIAGVKRLPNRLLDGPYATLDGMARHLK
jgi:hypothetical protein